MEKRLRKEASQSPFGLLTDWDIARLRNKLGMMMSQSPFGLLTDWDIRCVDPVTTAVASQSPFGLLTDWDLCFNCRLFTSSWLVSIAFRLADGLGHNDEILSTAIALASSQSPFGLLTDWDHKAESEAMDRAYQSQSPFGLLTDWHHAEARRRGALVFRRSDKRESTPFASALQAISLLPVLKNTESGRNAEALLSASQNPAASDRQ